MRPLESLSLLVVHPLLAALLLIDLTLGSPLVNRLAGSSASVAYDLALVVGYATVAASFRHRAAEAD